MDETAQPGRRASAMRLLAAALAGAIGAFGAPVGLHAAQQTAAAASATVPAVSPDTTAD